ncbi:MAG: endonuclease III [Candidatus Bathyarchaeia archaeon]
MKADPQVLFHDLKTMHGEPRVELNFSNPLELAVATILSAQCTDERVNKVTESLFRKYRFLEDYAEVSIDQLEEEIRSINFYRNKARTIKEFAREVKERFNGRIPEDVETLEKMKGVGRKSASMIAGLAFGKPAVIVDTHVKRVVQRIGLSSSTTPQEIESDLRRIIPEELWTPLSLLLILHGRYVCKARAPRCEGCLLREKCGYFRRANRL